MKLYSDSMIDDIITIALWSIHKLVMLRNGTGKDDREKKLLYMYKLLFSQGFYFREFREPDPRENFHFNSCLFIVMTTSEKS